MDYTIREMNKEEYKCMKKQDLLMLIKMKKNTLWL